MTPSLTPPAAPWLVIDSPLFVFPDGSWSLLISVLALALSGVTLWHTLSARARVHPFVVRRYLKLGNAAHSDGYEVVISNLGRTPAIIYGVRALDGKGRVLKTAKMPRGYEQVEVPCRDLPERMAPGGVLRCGFPPHSPENRRDGSMTSASPDDANSAPCGPTTSPASLPRRSSTTACAHPSP